MVRRIRSGSKSRSCLDESNQIRQPNIGASEKAVSLARCWPQTVRRVPRARAICSGPSASAPRGKCLWQVSNLSILVDTLNPARIQDQSSIGTMLIMVAQSHRMNPSCFQLVRVRPPPQLTRRNSLNTLRLGPTLSIQSVSLKGFAVWDYKSEL